MTIKLVTTAKEKKLTVKTAWPALLGVVVGRPEIVPDLVGQGQLRHFRRDPAVVVDKGDDAGVEAPLGRVVHAVDVLRVTLVRLANAAGGA